MKKASQVLILEGNPNYTTELEQITRKACKFLVDINHITTHQHAQRYLEIEDADDDDVLLVIIDPKTIDEGEELFEALAARYGDRMVVYTAMDAYISNARLRGIKTASKKKDIGFLAETLKDVLHQYQ